MIHKRLGYMERRGSGFTIRQIERLTGINRGVIRKAGNIVKKNRPQ